MGGRRGFFGVDGGPPSRLKIPAQALETASEFPLLPSTSAPSPAIDLRAPSPYTARAESMIRKQPVFRNACVDVAARHAFPNVRRRWRFLQSHRRPWERVAQPVEHVTFNHGV